MIPLSILELGRVRQGSDRRTALDDAKTLAQHAERLGYHRIWVAEHHNFPAVATAATSIVIAHIAANTSTIRVGAGGIMLPNHAPYVIAEQFGTLETLFPGRIDLGLGRAPGTDQMTLRALRRSAAIEAIPGSGTAVPLWILGSSLFGAQLAAAMGLPYGFASHFAPQALHEALRLYRSTFKPSIHLEKPYALVGVNVIAADTDGEARHLATSQQMSFVDMFRGVRGVMQPPIEDIETYWSPQEKFQAGQMLACSIVGSSRTVGSGLAKLVKETGADELMIVSDVFDTAKRLGSLELIAQATA